MCLTEWVDRLIVTATMPRLATIDYLRQRAALREEWFVRDAYAFAALSPTEQFAVHDFYELTKNLSPLELIAHRKDITARRPSLPQRAGRAFARIRPFLNLPPSPFTAQPGGRRVRTWSAKDRHVHVQSLVKPDLDLGEFAKIIMDLAKQGPPPGWKPDDASDQAPFESEPLRLGER